MLEVQNLHTYYGPSHILHGVSLSVPEGKVVALLGRNGAGKTTTLRSIIGLTPPRRGHVRFRGEDITGARPHRLARLGLSYMPETRGIFPSLSVEENLTLVAGRREGPWTLERVYELFPRLRERRRNGGAQLSGGEQQMLAIARALLLNPEVLLLDEPTEGLAPIVVRDIRERLAFVKEAGMTVLLVEQNFRFATQLADHLYVLGKGAVQWSGTPAEIEAEPGVLHTWLGV
ncbi:MAG: ABC transporter ATP-binding protein [Alphaproteobacteria bacterium]|nr:ABC transporter ATP-binding protein [Alphaproteobacteria bacterium]MDX5369415.1 ABC transporter ATP-binding protein [Alphaproteobacteria bacterium]MDX5464099.1 ABC transporter ATP-binding protein [Alphaproteobacteria bacterium]